MENHSNSAIKTATLFGPPHHHTDPTTDPIQLKNILKQALSVLIRELQASKSISSEGFLHQAAQALLEVIKKTPNLAKALREESHQIESLLKTRAVIYGHSDSQAQRQTSTAANNLQTNDSTQHQVPFAATLVDWRENEKSNPTPLPSGKHHGTDEERPNSDDFNLNLIDLG